MTAPKRRPGKRGPDKGPRALSAYGPRKSRDAVRPHKETIRRALDSCPRLTTLAKAAGIPVSTLANVANLTSRASSLAKLTIPQLHALALAMRLAASELLDAANAVEQLARGEDGVCDTCGESPCMPDCPEAALRHLQHAADQHEGGTP